MPSADFNGRVAGHGDGPAGDSSKMREKCVRTSDASPTMSERISKESVKGRVNDIGNKYVSIRSDDGESRRVRVDDHTKMDQVAVGDQVKAYVSEDGYASTIQRVVD